MLISIGRDLDGRDLVVGRARHEGDMLPAKVKMEHGIAYISYGGVEHIKHDFEVHSSSRNSMIDDFLRSRLNDCHGIPSCEIPPIRFYGIICGACYLSIARNCMMSTTVILIIP